MPSRHAFSLIELLVVLAIISILVGVLAPALSIARSQARAVDCLVRMRSLGQALTLYLDEHDGRFPATNHVGLGAGPEWDVQLGRYLGRPEVRRTLLSGDFYFEDDPEIVSYYNNHLRCPEDPRRRTDEYSYGQNVYFNLEPYAGEMEADAVLNGKRWSRRDDIPRPAATVIYGEVEGGSNHLMAHFWRVYGITPEIVERHQDHGNYVFADGHAEMAPVAETYDPVNGVDRWDPATAR